jgi:hypothetical protein
MPRTCWLILFAAALQVRPPGAPPNAARGSLEGRVFRANEGAAAPGSGIGGARVELKPDNVSATTRADGAFSFRNLPPGRHTILVTREGFIPLEDPRGGLSASGLTITLLEGQALKNVAIPMMPAPAISGIVFDPHGEPLAAALVQAYTREYTPYGPRVKIVKRAITNDLGEFRLFWLNFGEYAVSASYSERDLAAGLGSVRLSANVTKPDDGYATVYYAGALSLVQSQVVRLAPGSETSRLMINFGDTPRSTIRGRVLPAAPGTRVTLAPEGSDLADVNFVVRPDASGQFEIRGVSPDSYVLLATADNQSSDVVSAAVGGSGIDGLTIAMSPTANIAGRVIFQGRSPSNWPNLRVRLRRSTIRIDQTVQSAVNSDGTFILPQVGPGEYDVTVDPLPPDTYVKNIDSGGRDVLRGQARLDPSRILQVVLAAAAARVEGRVSKNGDPAGGIQVVLIPDPTLQRRTDRYFSGFTEPGGHFQLTGIPAGRYTAYAFERIEPGAYFALAYSSEARARFADRGVAVTAGEGGTEVLELKVIPAAETEGGLR